MNMNVYKVYEGVQPERMIQVPRNLLDPYSGQGDNDDETAQRGFSMQALREFLHTLVYANSASDMEMSTEDTRHSAKSTTFSRGLHANHANSTLVATRPAISLSDQFTWGAVVCASVFIVVFICVMTAWWIHKKQKSYIQRQLQIQNTGPFCIDVGSSNAADVQRPPSYYEVVGYLDPPPSYSDVSAFHQSRTAEQLYSNAATIDEPPPPFIEICVEEVTKLGCEPHAVNGNEGCTVIVIPSNCEGNDLCDSNRVSTA